MPSSRYEREQNERTISALVALRGRAGLSMGKIAKALGWKNASSYQRYEDPDLFTKPFLPLHIAQKLVSVLVGKGSPPIAREEVLMLAGLDDLTGSQIKSLDEVNLAWCLGEVAAGLWRDAFEWPRDEWLPVPLAIRDQRYPNTARSALLVRGDSMDQLYPDGSFVIFVRLDDIGRRPQVGDKVVVLRHRQGQTETTLKEYSKDQRGRKWLLPRSSNPSHQAIPIGRPGDDEETIEIVGLVVGSQRIE